MTAITSTLHCHDFQNPNFAEGAFQEELFASSFGSSETLQGFKRLHPELNLLDGMPSALELILRVQTWKMYSMYAPGYSSATSSLESALESFYLELARIHGEKVAPTRASTDKTQKCVKLLEKLNSAINEFLRRETLESRKSSAEERAEEQLAEEEIAKEEFAEENDDEDEGVKGKFAMRNPGEAPSGATSTAAAVPLPDRAIALYCAISMDENKTFIAMFRIAKATPRKMKRVVNV